MRKLIMWNMITLDGFFEGPSHDIGWFVFDDELESYIHETQVSADTLLFGRVTYELMAGYWPTAEGRIADFMNSARKVVVSRTLDKAEWTNTTLLQENVPQEVARLKEQPGNDIFVFGSANLSSTLMSHGLFDEYRIAVNPLVLGRGTPLFQNGIDKLNLKRLETRPLNSGVVVLHYAPAGN
jgi:dihydrofolate reductase